LLSAMCPDRTKCRQGSPDAPDVTSWGAWVQDAQDAQDAESRLGESGRNTPVSDAGHLFADGATTYSGLHNYTAVHSEEHASPTRLARSTSGKVPPAQLVDRSPRIRPAHGNHKINHPTRVSQSKSTSHNHPSNTTSSKVIATTKPTLQQIGHTSLHPNTNLINTTHGPPSISQPTKLSVSLQSLHPNQNRPAATP